MVLPNIITTTARHHQRVRGLRGPRSLQDLRDPPNHPDLPDLPALRDHDKAITTGRRILSKGTFGIPTRINRTKRPKITGSTRRGHTTSTPKPTTPNKTCNKD